MTRYPGKNKFNITVFVTSLLVLIFTILSTYFNVYSFKLTGALFELLWLPVCILIIAVPVMALTNWIRDKFSIKSLNFYSLVLSLATGLIILTA